MRRTGSIVIAVLLIVSGLTMAQDVSTKEAGAYERKSVTYVNALWLMDESVRGLSSDKVGYILSKVQNGISMKRFDYNPVPESYLTDFVAQANQLSFPPSVSLSIGDNDPMLDSITAVMERTIVPKILEVVDLAKEERAAGLTSEQQRNSFMADKAKTLGITMEDVDKIVNSAYIYIPLLRNVTTVTSDSLYAATISAGIIWFRISTKGEKARAIAVVKRFTASTGLATINKVYGTEKGPVDYKEFAFNSAVKNAVRNLVVATQEIPDFRLSSQVVDQGFMSVGFNLGKNEGLTLDDKYLIVETVEEADGRLTQKENGWVMVTSVADSSSKQGYKSSALVMAGEPYTGVVLSEYPRIPVDILFRGRMFPLSLDTMKSSTLFDSTAKIAGAYGGGIEAQYNIGKGGIGQFFLGLGGAAGLIVPSGEKKANVFGTSTYGKAKFGPSLAWAAELTLTKKFYIGRVALVLQPAFGYQSVILITEKSPALGNSSNKEETYRLSNAALGFEANAGLEIALSPSVNFGVGAGYQMYGSSKKWEYEVKKGTAENFEKISTAENQNALNHTGITAHVYLVWSPPALAFDPADAARGMAGL